MRSEQEIYGNINDTYNLEYHEACYITDLEIAELNTVQLSLKPEIQVESKQGIELPFMLESTDGIFAVLLFCFILFAQIYNGGLNYLKENYKLLFSSNSIANRDFGSTSRENAYSYFLVFQSLLLISIILYDVCMYYTPLHESVQTPLITILLFVLLLCLYLVVKVILYRVVGFIFDSVVEMKIWTRSYLVIFEILGIIFFFPTLFIIYSRYAQEYLIVAMLGALVIIHLIYIYRKIRYFIREKFNFLYLIAYLCTVEILPCVFLAIGIIYVYELDVSKILWLLK